MGRGTWLKNGLTEEEAIQKYEELKVIIKSGKFVIEVHPEMKIKLVQT